MPPYKYYQPTSLERLASARASRLALDSCLEIQRQCPKSQHLAQAKVVHGYFLAIRPLLDNVLNQSLLKARAEPLWIRAEVLLEALVHPTMKTLHYYYIKKTKSMPLYLSGFLHWSLHDILIDKRHVNEREYLRVDLTLWERYLPQLSSLAELNLIGIDTSISSQLMEVIATSCKQLEVISIDIDPNTDWKALRLLAQVTTLREIKSMESFLKGPFCKQYIGTTAGGNNKKVNPEAQKAFRYLLSKLPLLRYIPLHFTRGILIGLKDTHVDPLALVEFLEIDPTIPNLEAILDMCPNLVRLYLGDRYGPDTKLDLSPITASTLQISTLVFNKLKINNTLEDFFKIKGWFIKHLEFDSVIVNDLEVTPHLISKYCPLLENLSLGPGFNHYPSVAQTQEPIYQNLLEFRFETWSIGTDWQTLLSCLNGANKLKTLRLLGISRVDNEALTEALLHMLDNNRMVELEDLYIRFAYVDLLKELYTRLDHCPKLRNINFDFCELTPQIEHFLTELRAWSASKNLDLNVTTEPYREHIVVSP